MAIQADARPILFEPQPQRRDHQRDEGAINDIMTNRVKVDGESVLPSSKSNMRSRRSTARHVPMMPR